MSDVAVAHGIDEAMTIGDVERLLALTATANQEALA